MVNIISFLTVVLVPICTLASGIVTDTLLYNFTISAINTTLSNANATGSPLVLGQNGATTGVSFYVTSTYASYPYNDYPTQGLVNGTLRAFTKSGDWITNATVLINGGTLNWATSRLYTQPAASLYSVVHTPADRFPLLAAYGITNLWSLCPFNGFRGQTNVVFNVSADNPPSPFLGFDPGNCYGVKLNVVPLGIVRVVDVIPV